MTQKRGLGRGLGALIPGAGSTPAPEQELRTRTRPATSSGGESGSTRPVDMFFSGEKVSREEESAQRERAGAHDLATGMARAAAERRSRSGNVTGRRSTVTSTAKSPATAEGTAKPTDDTPATSPGSRVAKSTSTGGAAKRTSAAKTSGKASTLSPSSGNRTAKPEKAAPPSPSTPAKAAPPSPSTPAKASTPATATKSSAAKSPASRSSASKSPASKSSGSKPSTSQDAAPRTADAETEEQTTTAPSSAMTSSAPTGDRADAESPTADSAPATGTGEPTEDSPVVDVEKVTPTAPRSDTRADSPAPAPAPAQKHRESAAGDAAPASAEPETARQEPAADDAPQGRGLVSVPGAEFAEIPIHEVRENPRNPRTMFDDDELDELAHSLREVGVLQPVVVRPISVTADGESFELVMGERRWRAARRAGLLSIPAIIRETSDDDLLRDALLENLHRSQLNPLEEANAYQQLLDDFGCTQDELGDRIGRSRPQITNTLRLLRLPALVQRRLASGAISAGHARALLSLDDPRLMEELAQRIVQEGLSVRAVERLVARGGQQPATRTVRRSTYDPHVVDLTSRLSNRLEAPVRIDVGKRKGRVTLEFTNLEDLERLVENMGLDIPLPTGDQTDES
ncbi:chromosome partitioning protein ParB [Brachybacterium vulturis]|uniref:Chromosome partitioning protein ParB n=1 Tax=Brachybacterium vulturis TaxID=2017484 RepID=A0A291GKU5_9MICO|nr:ParB/RepB/Spo0J family partition protein [Brachybacterium vulturis]ATG50574.1 chromosome partitioning protein ParB [Brachybacterium vulturis]